MRKQITLNVNEIRTFELESHEGGGYLWTIVSNDDSIAKVQIKKQEPKRGVAATPLGQCYPTLVEIKALSPGKATILLEEKRSWEKDVRPLNTCRVYVISK